MRDRKTKKIRILACLALATALVVPSPGRSQVDDAVLFTAIVPPNVLLLLDNSGSMNNVMWHPAFDSAVTPTCSYFNNGIDYRVGANENLGNGVVAKGTYSRCGNTRTVNEDTGTGSAPTRWNGRYLNWYFSDEADAYASDIANLTATAVNNCVGNSTYKVYARARISALRQAMLDVVCEVNEGRGADDGVRFGTALFREIVGSSNDVNGGYVNEGIEDNTPQHANDLEAHINSIDAESWTPLSESLFQLYTYFMSRTDADRPTGVDGTTVFPKYVYDSVDGDNDPSKDPGDPIEYRCQRNFIVIVTDGEPTKDDFDTNVSNTDEAQGFGDFNNLIGDYNVDGETELPGGSDEPSYYLDDIAKYMHEHDFRPDLEGEQTMDIYTVGFITTSAANSLLQKTADVADGLFFYAKDEEELKTALIAALLDIIEKTQSFTASTVPASRTQDGADFYTSFFLPLGADPFWQGHLQAYHITGSGDIEDANGDCALVDPTAGECNSGPFSADAVPFWDAGEEIPEPVLRQLYTSKLVSSVPTRVAFNTSLTYTDLALQSFAADGNVLDAAPNRTYADSIALNEEGLADEIVQYIRGCEFGTGVQTTDVDLVAQQACVARDWRLADIFHSNPLVVGKPGAFILEPSYLAFKTAYATRDRHIYAGSNGGFMHAFHSGDWDASATPPGYDEGTGAEVFGFMPSYVRQTIKYQAVPTGPAEHYYADGSPDAADVWFYPTPTTTAKAVNGSEWHTALYSGLRQGGESYFALDVTDPSAAAFPGYLWDFPMEGDATYAADMGQTWGVPVVARIKVKVGSDDNGGDGYERFVVIVTAGYDVSGNPNHAGYVDTGTKGRAIFVLDAKTGAVIARQTLVGLTDSSVTNDADESYAMASTPAVLDLDFDDFADVVYVGDLGGNVWKWVIEPIAEDRANDGSGLTTQPSWTFKKFFQAPTSAAAGVTHYKSIFFPPSATLYSGKLYIAFGTGERADLGWEGATNSTADDNRFYVISDLDPLEQLGTPLATLVESNLTNVTSNATCQSISTRGFYFIADNGEKFVTNSEIFARDVIAASFTPTDLTDPCEGGGGESALYVFDVICSEGFFDDNGTPVRKLVIGEGFPTDPRISAGPDGGDNIVFIEKNRAEVESIFEDDINAAGSLLYWRELP